MITTSEQLLAKLKKAYAAFEHCFVNPPGVGTNGANWCAGAVDSLKTPRNSICEVAPTLAELIEKILERIANK